MATIYHEQDTDVSALAGQRIAVLGFGSQGHAHAQNLKDSGHDVRVGLRSGSSSRAKAEEAGLRVVDTAEAVAEADVAMVLLPDTSHGKVYAEDIAPNLNAGDMLMFAHGFSIHFGTVTPPADVDVTMIAPKGPGHLVRRTYEEGIGTPALVAVQQDATGKAKQRALAYGNGIGARPRGHHRDDVQGGDRDRPVRRADRAVRRAVRADPSGFDTLVAAGYQPEIAYFECLHEVKLIVDLIYEGGLSWMRHSISRHRRVGRLRLRRARDRRRDARDDAADPRRDPGRLVREAMDRGGRRRLPGVPREASRGARLPARGGGARAAADDAVAAERGEGAAVVSPTPT